MYRTYVFCSNCPPDLSSCHGVTSENLILLAIISTVSLIPIQIYFSYVSVHKCGIDWWWTLHHNSKLLIFESTCPTLPQSPELRTLRWPTDVYMFVCLFVCCRTLSISVMAWLEDHRIP